MVKVFHAPKASTRDDYVVPQAILEMQQIDRVWYIGIGMCFGVALAGIIMLILAIAGII